MRFQVHGVVSIPFSVEMDATDPQDAEAFIKTNGVPDIFWDSEEIDVFEVREVSVT